jgi:hypothetical protein
MKTIRIIVVIAALFVSATTLKANFIQLGEIDLTGTFTVNHLYDVNNHGAASFGRFGTLTVQSVTGIFSPYVTVGDTLGMNRRALNTVQHFPLWTIGGYTFSTNFVGIFAAGFSVGVLDLSGNGFDPNNYPPYGANSHWEFWSPAWPSDITHDVTGPINLSIFVGYDNGHVPEEANTGALFFVALSAFLLGLRSISRKTIRKSCASKRIPSCLSLR